MGRKLAVVLLVRLELALSSKEESSFDTMA
jgi:hypothetical protein